MFWIPLCAVVLFVYWIASLIGAVKTGIYQREYNNYQKAKEALVQRAVDYDLESDLDYTLDLQIGKWKSTVREFMGGGSEWEDYTDFASGKLKAKIIIMARQGKLPAWLINFGVSLPLAEDTLHKPGPHQIRPARGIEMNERFVLRLESFLNNTMHIPVIAYVWTTRNGEIKPMHHMPLQEFLREYGSGSTHYFTRFQFVSRN